MKEDKKTRSDITVMDQDMNAGEHPEQSEISKDTCIPMDLGQNQSSILAKKVEQLAQLLSLDPEQIMLWLKKFALVNNVSLNSLLHLAITYKLDPLMGEVTLWMDAQKQAHPSITIDGWMKIINAHPAFSGIEFVKGPALENQGISTLPQFMQCVIYRRDRQLPVRVSEYLVEVKNDHPLWKSMPRRMLRHRALQQCARLAFGISTPEFAAREFVPSIAAPYAEENALDTAIHLGDVTASTEDVIGNPNPKKITRTDQLKVRLSKTKPAAESQNRASTASESLK